MEKRTVIQTIWLNFKCNYQFQRSHKVIIYHEFEAFSYLKNTNAIEINSSRAFETGDSFQCKPCRTACSVYKPG